MRSPDARFTKCSARRAAHGLAVAILVAPPAAAQVAAAAERGSATVTGVVYDSLARAPLAGAEVQLVREGASSARSLLEATTDSRGRFTITNVVPGSYVAGFLNPVLDSLGLGAPLVRLTVEPGRGADVELAVASLNTFVRALCHLQNVPDSATIWVGSVRDAASRAARAGATVSVQWAETAIGRAGIYRVRRGGIAQAREDGRFTVCNAPADASLFVTAAEGRDTSGVVLMRLPEHRLLMRDLYVGRSEPAAPESTVVVGGVPRAIAVPRRGPATLDGTVRTTTGQPLAGARVQLAGASASAVTADDGTFRLAGLPAGSWMLEVRSVGFEPLRMPVDLADADEATKVSGIVLEKAIFALDTVKVIAGPANVLVRGGFMARKDHTFGTFIDHAMIEKRQPFQLREMVQDLPGMLVLPHTAGSGPTLLMKINGGLCPPPIYIDGQRFHPGDDAEQMLATIDPGDVAGIEVYNRPGNIPIEFGGTLSEGCGVIVVWTDHRMRAREKPPG